MIVMKSIHQDKVFEFDLNYSVGKILTYHIDIWNLMMRLVSFALLDLAVVGHFDTFPG